MRDNWSVTFALSYNSQIWRQQPVNGSVWLLGEDLGEGLGWTLQAAAVRPIWYNGLVQYWQYSDSTGAQYALDTVNGSNVWTSSTDGIYVYFDANADVLHMTDGSFWKMNVISASPEQDAGTQYPSRIEDSNGNYVAITYMGAVGETYNYNTSSRIGWINDGRGPGGQSYSFGYSGGNPIPHLSSITNYVGTGESYQFWFTTVSPLLDPFTGSSFPAATVPYGIPLESQHGTH